MGLGAVAGNAEGDKGLGSLGLVNLTFWQSWARCPKIVFIGAISCHVGVRETIKGVAISCFNGYHPCLLDWEAKTRMVEAHKCADAGEVKCLRVLGSAGCLGCHSHGLGHLMQEHDQDVLPGGAGSPGALARVRQEC